MLSQSKNTYQSYLTNVWQCTIILLLSVGLGVYLDATYPLAIPFYTWFIPLIVLVVGLVSLVWKQHQRTQKKSMNANKQTP